MALNGTTLISELQNWPNYFVVGSIVNKYEIPFPTKLKESDQVHHDNSFIRLLFDDNWSGTEYRTEFEPILDYGSWPHNIRQRLMIYPSSKYYRLTNDSTSSVNVFFLDEDLDIPMLDTLMQWRNDSTSVSIIDSTAIINPELVYDNDDLELTVNYNTLTSLGKLIYCLLDLEIYNQTYYLETTNINSNTILEHFFELYVNDKLFKFLSSRGWTP